MPDLFPALDCLTLLSPDAQKACADYGIKLKQAGGLVTTAHLWQRNHPPNTVFNSNGFWICEN